MRDGRRIGLGERRKAKGAKEFVMLTRLVKRLVARPPSSPPKAQASLVGLIPIPSCGNAAFSARVSPRRRSRRGDPVAQRREAPRLYGTEALSLWAASVGGLVSLEAISSLHARPHRNLNLEPRWNLS